MDEQARTLPIHHDKVITRSLTFSKHLNGRNGEYDAEGNEDGDDEREHLEGQRTLGRSLHVDCQGLGVVVSKDVDLDRPLIFQLLEYGDEHGGIEQLDPIDPLQYIA